MGSLPDIDYTKKVIHGQLKTINQLLNGLKSNMAGYNLPDSLNQCQLGSECIIYKGFCASSCTTVPIITGNTVYVTTSNRLPYRVNSSQFSTIKSTNNVINIHCGSLVSETNSISVLNKLQSLYAWHSLLSQGSWVQFSKGIATAIQIPTLNGSSMFNVSVTFDKNKNELLNSNGKTILANLQDLYTVLPTIIENDGKGTFNVFLLRRIVYANIILHNYVIAMSYYNAVFNSNVNKDNARGLVESIYMLLAQANYLAANKDGGAAMLNKKINNRSIIYGKNLDSANILADDLEDKRRYLKERQDIYNNDRLIESKAKIFSYVMIAIFIIIALTAIGLFIFGFERRTRLTVAVWLVVASLVIGIVMYYTYSYFITEYFISEGFATGALSNFGAFGISANDWESIKNNTNEVMLNAIQEFYANTLMINNSLSTYKIMGNVNGSMQRELSFFFATRDLTYNQALKYKEVGNVVVISRSRYTYMLFLFVSLSIILSLTTVGYIYLEEDDLWRLRILILGFILACIALFIFILEINFRVRTNAHTYYWKSPGDPEKYRA